MLLRNRAVALITCWAASPLASALGLGPLEATSALNEPFKGRIEIVGAKIDDFETLKIGLAGEDQFQRAGVERPPVLFKLHFSVDDSSEGKEFISVTSSEPIREPFLNFLLELNWANGRLVREYTVLLDPPLYDPNRRRTPAQAGAPAAAPATPAAVPAPTYYPPPRAAGSAATAPAASASPAAAPAAPQGGEIGPVGATDTLWSLAAANRPDPSVSIQQMMVALLRANPDAFVNGNVNMLRRGVVLRTPDDATLRGVSNQEAVAEVRRQHQLWQEYRQHIGAAPATQALGTAAPAAPASAPAETAAPAPAAGDAPKGGDARLELVAPGGAESAGGAAKPGKGAGDGAGSGSSTLLREQLDSTAQQAGDLKTKLTEAEQVIDLLQRQVNIKDQELAALQARLAELGVKAPPAPADEAAPATTEPKTGEAKPAEDTTAATTPKDETKPAEPAADTTAAQPEAKSEPKPETTAAKPAAEPEPVIDVPTEPAGTAGFPANLVPQAIAESVPGGALTVLGAVALAVVGVIVGLLRALTRKRGDAPTRPVTAVPASTYAATEDDDSTTVAATTAAAATAAAVALAPEPTQDEIDSEAVTTFDPGRTVVDADTAPIGERTVQGLGAVADEADPLEEVNVYLAYERFDQAEDLVKRVISQHPDRHEYKLRLLEVYYSSNDRARYEEAARGLRDAVGEQSPLWESALAMWAEMSPDRALFAEGAASPAAIPAEAATAFVDITGDTVGESTVTHARGGHDTLDLDFGLAAEAATAEEGAGVIDLTGGDSELLDLSGGDDLDGMLDLTSADDQAPVLDLTSADDDGLLDITGGDANDSNILDLSDDAGLIDISGSDDAGMLDISGSDDEGMLDITGSSTQDGLLDITGGGADDNLVDITGSGAGDDSGLLDISGGSDVIDIGGTDDVLDITSGGSTVSDLLDVSVGAEDLDGMGADLLDVTHTGDIGQLGDRDLLNVTSPGAHALEASAGPTALDLDIGHDFAGPSDAAAEDDALAFDISDTVAPAFGANADIAPEPPAMDVVEDGLDLDFDIGGLEVDDVPTVELKQIDAPASGSGGDDLDLDISAGELGDSDLDFDITMGAEDLSSALGLDDDNALGSGLDLGTHPDTLAGELSLQGEELDALALDAGGDLDGDFDFSLDGTSEINPIAAEDTLDMSSVALANAADLELDDNTSLDDLTIELDSALANTRPAPADAPDEDPLHLDTLALDLGDDGLELGDDRTVLLPATDDVERQSDSDEADTKLNLAKAYIELGDAEGARSILDEVANEGSAAQQAEAKSLLGQLDA